MWIKIHTQGHGSRARHAEVCQSGRTDHRTGTLNQCAVTRLLLSLNTFADWLELHAVLPTYLPCCASRTPPTDQFVSSSSSRSSPSLRALNLDMRGGAALWLVVLAGSAGRASLSLIVPVKAAGCSDLLLLGSWRPGWLLAFSSASSGDDDSTNAPKPLSSMSRSSSFWPAGPSLSARPFASGSWKRTCFPPDSEPRSRPVVKS